MKLGLWHEGVVGDPATKEAVFEQYCAAMIRFIEKAGITRSFFCLMDPAIPAGKYTSWMKTYWLDKLPANCEAGVVPYIRDEYPWTWKPELGDNVQQCFHFIAEELNSGDRQVTCVAFDSECLGSYKTPAGVQKIADAWSAIFPNLKHDFGWAGALPGLDIFGHQMGAAYPELYWIGDVKKPNLTKTSYLTYLNKPTAMFEHEFQNYMEKKAPYFQTPGVWPMFSTEHISNPQCPHAKYGQNSMCGTFNGFGVWDWDSFYAFLQHVSITMNTKEIMIYEWQFIPESWIPSA